MRRSYEQQHMRISVSNGSRIHFRLLVSRTSPLSIMALLHWLLHQKPYARAWSPRVARYRPSRSYILYPRASCRLEAAVTHKDDTTLDNKPSLWKGASHATSEFVTHVIASDDAPTVADAIQSVLVRPKDGTMGIGASENSTSYSSPRLHVPLDNSLLLPEDLLELGACWFLPASAPRDPALGGKPVRLCAANATQVLENGDYLRLHHSPRRFPQAYQYSWTAWHPVAHGTPSTGPCGSRPGVVVARNDKKGFWVLDKPANIPVHPTVDNVLENMAELMRRERQYQHNESEVYVATPQRLDQNTSGLLVVATKKMFASYFAKLLRRKTYQQLSSDDSRGSSREAIHKTYRCLVCLKQDGESSVTDDLIRLRNYAEDRSLIRHYLEPSIRAPKHFAQSRAHDTWAECLLRLTGVGEMCALVGSAASNELSLALWSRIDSIPSGCVAVVQLEVELLTGRTHQIRGQLAAEGFPLVGDAQYGGAAMSISPKDTQYYVASERLALQCCQLEFLDPDLVVKEDGETLAVPSDRWNSYQLEESWWSPALRSYQSQSRSSAAIPISDVSIDLERHEGPGECSDS